MELKDTGKDYLDLDFEIPQTGVSIVQFEEGIQKRTNESSGKTTLQLPMVIDRVVEGPEDNTGKKMSHFVPIESGFGEKQLAVFLTIVGLMGAFSKKFGNDVDVTDDAFINALKLKLPGKFVTTTHEVRKDNSGKDRVNVTRFEKVGGYSHRRPTPADPEDAQAGDVQDNEGEDSKPVHATLMDGHCG